MSLGKSFGIAVGKKKKKKVKEPLKYVTILKNRLKEAFNALCVHVEHKATVGDLTLRNDKKVGNGGVISRD